ncbi:putative FAD-dependent monooxygenase [Arthrobacter crystallopoietes BAB-32]|uniref:Putative FAD-dependent monooxygenase n=1 Tax=Arthrobacter crystallopoietes BAB-32 TaxID=1246476 RepID=N1UR53_9MICC|nr:FAD-dependent monooxygenase [Arthrobacter crystallopoietes]EMY32896.1 putative FAD-dependent monooxygenase [Arthrobacter crystallopoietes BAB-32]
MIDRKTETDVLVVGAGPTGLMLANWLLKLGVRTVLADAKSGPTRESRALGLQARSLEIYDQLGVADTVQAESTLARRLYLGYESKVFGMLPLGRFARGLTPYEGITFYEQSKNEALLADNLATLGGSVLWHHRLTALDDEPGGQGVNAVLTGPDGDLAVRARYCVGTDGGSSTVRTLRGIPFEGVTNPASFFVADATQVRGLSHDGVNIRPGTEDFLLGFPMVGDAHIRLIGTVPDTTPAPAPGENNDDGAGTAVVNVTEAEVRERLARVYSVTYGASTWFSTYRVHHRVAARFRDGPVFLAGDAAHVHSPVGAQGMNTGLQDAHNLAFKLADVLQGRAGDRYLDRYEAERRPVAHRLVTTTDRVFGFITSTNPAAGSPARRAAADRTGGRLPGPAHPAGIAALRVCLPDPHPLLDVRRRQGNRARPPRDRGRPAAAVHRRQLRAAALAAVAGARLWVHVRGGRASRALGARAGSACAPAAREPPAAGGHVLPGPAGRIRGGRGAAGHRRLHLRGGAAALRRGSPSAAVRTGSDRAGPDRAGRGRCLVSSRASSPIRPAAPGAG